MSPNSASLVCCIAGCSRRAEDCSPCHPNESVCVEHSEMAAPALRARLETTLSRLGRLNRIWEDESAYSRVVESGKYLKLCDATQLALDFVDSAWLRFKLDIVLCIGKDRSAPSSAAYPVAAAG